MRDKIGNRIKAARLAMKGENGRRITQEELGKLCDWKDAQGRVSKYETGEREPTFDDLLRMSAVLNVDILYLLGQSVDPKGRTSEVNPATLTEALILIEKYCLENRIEATQEQRAKLASAVYKFINSNQAVPGYEVIDALLDVMRQ